MHTIFYSIKIFLKNRFLDMWSIVDDAIINNDDGLSKGRRGMLFGNYFVGIISSLIGGVYLTGLMLYMGASDIYIGSITIVTSICTFLQLFAPLIIERWERRKNILIVLRGIMYFLNIICLGIIPILPFSPLARLSSFMLTIVAINLISSFSSSAFCVWNMQSVPLNKRVNFFSLSNLGGQILSVLSSFFAALIVDGTKSAEFSILGLSPEYCAFLFLRLIAVFLVIAEFKNFLAMPEFPYEKDTSLNNKGLRLLFLPLKNKDFMKLAFIVFIWNFLSGFIGPYLNVYLLENVKMSYTYLSFSGLIGLPLTIVATPIWAKLINCYSWLKMFIIALIGYCFTFILNASITASAQFIYIISVTVFYLFNPAVTLNFSNIQFIKLPPANQTAFCSFYSAFITVGSILGNAIGTGFFGITEGKIFNILGFNITNYQLMSLIQLVFAVFLVLYVILIRTQLRRDPENAALNI